MTWTICYTEADGTAADLGTMPEDKAKALLDGVHRHIDPTAVLVDLVAELSARLPVGSRVRHTTTGWAGTVTHDQNTDPLSAHVVRRQYSLVCVRWDHRPAPEWFNTRFIEPAPRR